ncbi:MAG: hypothetical protein JEY91_16585 [Spirochaetaceae bacterium]|nr:hypothetical protein [Spirochaetaceae bacterium]
MSFTDSQTFDELNIIRNKYSSKNIIDKINETVTTEGKQNLINHLRFPMVSINEIQSFQELITNIIENIEYWNPFQELLLSDAYSKIIVLKQRQLVQIKPLLPFEYSYFSPQSINPNYLFIKKLNNICQNITENRETPKIIN